MARTERWLKIAFAAGAFTDALALVPMLSPHMARLLWGIDTSAASYLFAMGYGASLMLGWTLLLVWAYQAPVERRAVALLTLVVIAGLASAEVVAVALGAITLARVAPTWVLQAALAALFTFGYLTAERAT